MLWEQPLKKSRVGMLSTLSSIAESPWSAHACFHQLVQQQAVDGRDGNVFFQDIDSEDLVEYAWR